MIPAADQAAPTNTGHGGRTVAWTEERVDELKTLHARGWSAGMIAAAMEGVSRNAVIGKLNRLGLQGGADEGRDTARAQTPRADGEPAAPRSATAAAETEAAHA